MDAMKLLGELLKNKSLSSGLGKQLLEGLLGGGGQTAPSGQSGGGGGLADILGGVLGGGGSSGGAAPSSGGGLMEELLGAVLGGAGRGSQPSAPRPSAVPAERDTAANEQAILMIRAMINAAKADGRVDSAEQENILSKMGNDISQAEVDFLKTEFARPVDVDEFARSVPRGLEQQVYALSVTSIDLDTQNEAQYLGQLAQIMNLDPRVCNQIHDQLGAPKIFR